MKKTLFVVVSFLMAVMFVIASQAFAADWSQYESGRDNIRLDGYQNQPGYIALTGGDGIIRGYLYAGSDGSLRWIPRVSGSGSVSTGAFDLTTTKISGNVGYALDLAD